MPADTINGIPRIDPQATPTLFQRALRAFVSSGVGTVIHRAVIAPLDGPVMHLTGGRFNLSLNAAPIVVLACTGARSGQRREVPLIYFTDGDDVVLIASNYGGTHHPAWYHNLVAHPQCELHIGGAGGRFVAREATGADHGRLFELATALYPGYAGYAERTDGVRPIHLMRLSPAA